VPIAVPTATTGGEAELQATLSAIAEQLQASVPPRVMQSLTAPDGRWQAEVIQYVCTDLAGQESPWSYEQMILRSGAGADSLTVEAQTIQCGGLGAFGLAGKFWSADSRFFYYTNAREGWPDGGYPWRRPLSRYVLAARRAEILDLAVPSPDERRVAGVQGDALAVWDLSSGAATVLPPPEGMPEGAWINALAWSPDGRTLAYLVQTRCSDRYPCPSALWRVDPTTGQAARLLSLEDPPGIDVTWSDPQRMLLMGGDFRTFYSVDAATGKLLGALTPTPPATAAAPAAAPAAATAAATATPVAPATPVASASADR
jgi:hypothetical protein